MEINNTLAVIGDDKRLSASIQSICELPYELPYIMTQGIQLLDDNSHNKLSDTELKSLCYMLDMYFGSCFYEYADNLNLGKLLKFAKIEIYKVQAANGLRYATENEVTHGIKGLIPEYIYPAGEDTYKKLCLLQWTFTGVSYYFRQVGYSLQYSSSGEVLNTFWELLQMSAVQLKEMMDWVKCGNNLEKALKIIAKMKKAGGYKYAQYESDEIEESITVKQLVYNIMNTFPRNSNDLEYRKALALALAKSKNNRALTPYEISQMRRIYEKYALDKDRKELIGQSSSGKANVLQEECERILQARSDGILDAGEFVFKIIDTVRNSRYTKCSSKQYKFIEEALARINENHEVSTKAEVITEDEIDASLMDMYDALGSGLFEG